MIDLPYCKKCSELGNVLICDDCKPKLRDKWREEIPDRYRTVELDVSDSKLQIGLRNFGLNFLANYTDKRTGFLLYGGVGTGKSHLLCGLVNYIFSVVPIRWREQISPVMWMPDQRFVSIVQWANSAKGNRPMHDIIESLAIKSKKQLLIIDDVGQGTPRADVALAGYNYLIDQIYSRQGWLAIASNYKPSEMVNYIGHYSVDRLRQMCGKENMFEMQGESLRK